MGNPKLLQNGADRRSAQIAELLARTALPTKELQVREELQSYWRSYCAGWKFACQTKLTTSCFPPRLRRWGTLVENHRRAFKTLGDAGVFLWERTRTPIPAWVAREMGLTVILLQHNIDSLVWGHKDSLTGRRLPASLLLEIRYLQLADVIFCISREEHWFLRALGLNAAYLPYYPPQSEVARFMRIREKRPSTPKRHFLILGSAVNTPTREGMHELLTVLAKLPSGHSFLFEVVGRGVDSLAPHHFAPWIRFRNDATDELLDQLLAESHAVIAFQRSGVGALTRIPEMLLAGVPVIANLVAARSAFDLDGVYVFEDWAELFNLMRCPLAPPEAPDPPASHENRFMRAVMDRKLCPDSI